MADLYTDNDVSIPLANRLRSSGHNVVTARGLGGRKAGDEEHLLTAAQQGRTFITHDGKDFLLLHNAWRRWALAWGVTVRHAGVVVIPRRVPLARVEAAIVALIQSGRPRVNALYIWREQSGWSAVR